MKKYKNKFHIESTRLPSWDYGSNAPYFVTICTKNKSKYFGEIIDNKIRLTSLGKIAQNNWFHIPQHFPFVKLDEFVIMPNHIHGIIVIDKPVETQNIASNKNICHPETQNIASNKIICHPETQNIASLQKNQFGPQSQNLASIIRGYKSSVTKYARINNITFTWQSRYYDHIIRNYESWEIIRQYIRKNPINWLDDEDFQI